MAKVTDIKIVIPARLHSARLPNKILLPINGKPIVQHVYEACLKAGFHRDDVIVAIDHEDTWNALKDYNTNMVFTRQDYPSGTDRVRQVAKDMNWSDDTYVINIQGDEPMIDPKLILQLVGATQYDHGDIFTLCTPLTCDKALVNPDVVKVALGRDNRAVYFSRSPIPFKRDVRDRASYLGHIGVYGYTVKTLNDFYLLPVDPLEDAEKLEQLRALANGMTIKAYLACVPHWGGIDTNEEYLEMKARMEK